MEPLLCRGAEWLGIQVESNRVMEIDNIGNITGKGGDSERSLAVFSRLGVFQSI